MASTHDLRVEKIFSVKDYVCLVTGGGTGIGLMATQALAANGAKVYITGRRKEVLENAARTHNPEDGGQIIPAGPCDVTSKEDLEKLVKEISSKEKYLNLLITNAGIPGPKAFPSSSSASELSSTLWSSESVPEWSSVFTTNVTSVYFTTVAFLPLLQASQSQPSSSHPSQSHHPARSPSVIVISSMSGLMRNSQGHFAYNAAKAATVHLSKLMSSEFEKTNIRVNSIAPGYFPSELTARSKDEGTNKSELSEEAVREKGYVPAQRAGSDEEMAMAVIFLCRNVYVNGEVVAVDGGVMNRVPGR
ncbi:MAG: hypothetical protein Q9190_006032 [Brigantiaea leucoxantha]